MCDRLSRSRERTLACAATCNRLEPAATQGDGATAERLQRFIYASGNSIEPSAAFQAFRGRPARVEPLLRNRGLLDEPA